MPPKHGDQGHRPITGNGQPGGLPPLDLSGEWEFSPDGESWGSIVVPGCWESPGYSADLEGPVVYQRRFVVPEDWHGWRASLRFGAASYRVRAWLNGAYLGQHEGIWDAFSFQATPWLRAGGENLLRVEVIKPGRLYPWQDTLAGFLPEISLPFGGLWQPVALRPHGDVTLAHAYVRAALRGAATAFIEVRNYSAVPRQVELEAEVRDPGGRAVAHAARQVRLGPGLSQVRLPLTISDPLPWEPQTPHLYLLRLRLREGGEQVDGAERPFGVREIGPKGRQVWLNGRPVLLRGVLHWGFYPQRLAPAPSEAEIRDELIRVRDLGFNLVKHCLWVPPERYQDLADELGMLLWQELPLWPPTVSPAQRRRALRQVPALVRQRRGHPSLVLYTLGCELNDSADAPFLRRLYRSVKRLVPDALVRDNSGSGECYGGLVEDFADFYDYHFYAEPEHLERLMDAFAAPWRRPRPWLFGEFCDSDTFQSVAALRGSPRTGHEWWLSGDPARNPLAGRRSLPILEQDERLQKVELPCDAVELQRRSYARSLAVRKQGLECARRYPSLSGYVVTSLRDVPTVTSGLFDDAGQEKWPGQLFRAFNADTVILLCTPPQRDWIAGGDRLAAGETYCGWAGERFRRVFVVSHFAPGLLTGVLRWRVQTEPGVAVAEGESGRMRLRAGEVTEVGALDFDAPEVAAPVRLTVRAWIEPTEAGVPPVHNTWPLWLYPRRTSPMSEVTLQVHDPGGGLAWLAEQFAAAGQGGPRRRSGSGLLVASCADGTVLETVRRGGRALVLHCGGGQLPTRRLPFWREGLPLLFPHPTLAGIPNDGYADLAWESLACDLAVDSAQLDALLGGVGQHRPILRRLDCRDFSVADYVGEVRWGQGLLLYTTLAFERAASPEWGLERSPLASFLLDRFVRWLAEPRPALPSVS